ncbi:protein FAR1-RELATED SEQUENCE 5-like [Abrus precatorius]|uniref:Protein FAR1-RELATED SEQUENCE 5-like n=1 Tax=Abrus precatorius TaxID=3816 RepID=A0A8B8M5T9_ABRPR|nr:protein FAR1-RELATED SEQUENCE 5-like [Abrus precatorius]
MDFPRNDEGNDEVVEECNVDEEMESSDEVDMQKDGYVNLSDLCSTEIKRMEFLSVEECYKFYNKYGKINGFSVRKNKGGKSKNEDVVWQQFVCSSQGFRREIYRCNLNRLWEHRAITRFGCEAEMEIRFDVYTGCWVVCRFFDDHNHNLVDENYFGMLRSHRKMDDGDVEQMHRMRKSGIPTCKI